MQKKLLFYVGTLAELIKLVPIMKRLDQTGIKFDTISSGQVDIKENELQEIYNVSIDYKIIHNPKKVSSIFYFILWFIKCFVYSLRFFKKIKNQNYTIIVHGDTTSSLIGAVCGKLSGLKVAHIESGLRSFNFLEPFPEEISRFLVSKVSDLHFCPNEWSLKNIKKENGEKINTIQNTSYEMLKMSKKLNKISPQILEIKSKYFLTVIHRQENIYFKTEFLRKLIEKIVNFAHKDLKCVLVLHKITEQFLIKEGLLESLKNNSNIILLPRTPYIEFINTISKAEFMLTDGGSNQEEAFYLGIPTLILRNYTERIEGLEENVLLMKGSLETLDYFLHNYKKYQRPEYLSEVTPSSIIVNRLLENNVEELKWDSDFFGYKIGRIKISEKFFYDRNELEDYKLIYIFDNTKNSNKKEIENIGGKLVDVKTELVCEIKENNDEVEEIKDFSINTLGKEDFNKDTIDLSLEAGKYSRFKKDNNFKKNEFKKLYTKWIENSLNRINCFEVIGIRQKNKIIGLVSLSKISDEELSISLIAVNKNFQNKGFGTALVKKAIEIAKKGNFKRLSVTTQEDNINAMKFYQKLNFVIRKKESIYHLWN